MLHASTLPLLTFSLNNHCFLLCSSAPSGGNELLHLSGPVNIHHQYSNVQDYGHAGCKDLDTKGPPGYYHTHDGGPPPGYQQTYQTYERRPSLSFQQGYEVVPPTPVYEDNMFSPESSSSLNMSMTTQGMKHVNIASLMWHIPPETSTWHIMQETYTCLEKNWNRWSNLNRKLAQFNKYQLIGH